MVLRHRFGVACVVCVAMAAPLLLLALTVPAALAPIRRGWMRFAWLLGWVNTRVLLVTAFFLLVTPISLLLRLFGRDPLQRRFDARKSTYWQERPQAPADPTRYTRQY